MTRPRKLAGFALEERLSPREAAERLVDIAYALTAGGTLELRAGDEQVRVPIGAEVRLKRESKPNGDRIEVEVWLSWSA
jgi:amphi-Trp domain-containing protein